MIKRTLHFGNPARLYKENNQLVVDLVEDIPLGSNRPTGPPKVPIEDIGFVVLDHPQITLSHALIAALLENNVTLVTSNQNRMPTGMMLPLSGNEIQSERFREQIDASIPLKKQLWAQTITAKILNQARVLINRGKEAGNLIAWAREVKSGDPDNFESRAAVHYWKVLFEPENTFRRTRDGDPPNNLLNYGYAILRATVARALVGTGLLPTLGIHHSNKYNAYCLADDIMEPYRPYVDRLVCEIAECESEIEELTPALKKQLLVIPALDIEIEGQKSPLMVGVQRTTASLARCFGGKARRITYPVIPVNEC